MRNSCFLLSLGLVACGGDDGAQTMVDARAMTVDRDLSCLNFTPPSVPMTIMLESVIYDVTAPPDAPPVPSASLTVTSLDGATPITAGTSDVDGKLSLTLTTNGQPTRFRYALDVADFPKILFQPSVGPTKDTTDMMRAGFPATKQSRIDAIATALGATLDPSKGSLEVHMFDCSGSDYYAATPAIVEEPGTMWAMNGGANAWLPRPTTLHSPNFRNESITGTVNLTPGMKSFTLKDTNTTVGPVPFYIEAGTHTVLLVFPGYPRLI
jgi:hypothetical protein